MNLKFYKCSVEPTGAENGAVWFDTTNSKIYVKEDGSFIEYSKQEKPLILNGEYKQVEGSDPVEYTINVTTQDESPLFSTIKSALTSQRPIYLFVSTKLSFGSMYYTSSEGILIPLEAVHHYDKYTNKENIDLKADFYFLTFDYNLVVSVDINNNLNTFLSEKLYVKYDGTEDRYYVTRMDDCTNALYNNDMYTPNYNRNYSKKYLIYTDDFNWNEFYDEFYNVKQDWNIKGDFTE